MIHYCPQCGSRSWHEPGVWPWAVPCPDCGCVAAQQPHPPTSSPEPLKRKGRRRSSGPKAKGPTLHTAEATAVMHAVVEG